MEHLSPPSRSKGMVTIPTINSIWRWHQHLLGPDTLSHCLARLGLMALRILTGWALSSQSPLIPLIPLISLFPLIPLMSSYTSHTSHTSHTFEFSYLSHTPHNSYATLNTLNILSYQSDNQPALALILLLNYPKTFLASPSQSHRLGYVWWWLTLFPTEPNSTDPPLETPETTTTTSEFLLPFLTSLFLKYFDLWQNLPKSLYI